MPRGRLIRSDTMPYHLWARSNNRDWFYLETAIVWEIFCAEWEKVCLEMAIRVHAFVLMSNHFHAIVTTPNANVDAAMEYLLRQVARSVNERTGRINHLFGGPYKWSLVTNRLHYEHVFRYVLQNPLKAGLCDQVEKYSFSSLYFQTKNLALPFEIVPSIFEAETVYDGPLWHELEWLNARYTQAERETIRKSLTYRIAKLRKNKISNTLSSAR